MCCKLSLNHLLFFFIVVVAAMACVPPKQYDNVNIELTDPFVQHIFDLQDRQLADSLPPYLSNENPAYRRLAALAFGSIADSAKTTKHIDTLGKLLRDPFVEVRAAAAFSLGQLGQLKAEPLLVAAFDRTDTLGAFTPANAAILEAIGKCGSESSLRNLAGISTFTAADSALVSAQALGILRFSLRNIISSEGTATQFRLLKDVKQPLMGRMAAAYYFSRLESFIPDSNYLVGCIALLSADTEPSVRMAMAKALGRTQNPTAQAALAAAYKIEKMALVRINIVRALGKQPYLTSQPTLLAAVRDSDVQVALVAAQALVETGSPLDGMAYFMLASDSKMSPMVQLKLMAATLTHLPYKGNAGLIDTININLKQRFAAETNSYTKAAVLTALGAFPFNYTWIQEQGAGFNVAAPIKTAALDVLRNLSAHPNFGLLFKGRIKPVREELQAHFYAAIRSKDVGSMVVAAEALGNPVAGFLPVLRDSILILTEAQKQLQLPRDLEAYEALQLAINVATGATTPNKKIDYNHPIEWSIYEGLTNTPTATVTTNKGAFTIALSAHLAPATVANFIKLAKQGFFNNKPFHRVVGNFVAQTGCPRGDGYGSTDFTIRSEFGPEYFTAGAVGMASLGAHTESCQWFVTHSPAFHLDGKYTYFGRVVTGLPVAQLLEIGDLVQSVTIL